MSVIPTAESEEGSPVLYQLIDAAREWVSNHPLSLQQSGPTVLRDNSELPKVTMCKFFMQGKCRFGDKCRNSHGGQTSSKKVPSAVKNTDAPQTHGASKVKKDREKDAKSKNKQSKDNIVKDEGEKKVPMRTADDVISRILWDPDLPSDEFKIGYLDRFVGIIEKPFSLFSWEDLATVGINVLAVPKHRIQYFKFRNEIVWDKRSQMDNFFGSRGGKIIQDIVAEQSANQKDEVTQLTDSAAVKPAKSENELIEIDLDQDDMEQHAHRGYIDRDRPTHFVCFRITDDQVKENVSKIQDHITTHTPLLIEGCLPITALHVTLCMVRLENDEQISIAQEVMRSVRSQFIQILPRCSQLDFTGVSNFHERLVYVKVAPCPALDTFVFSLIEKFQEAGLHTPGNHKEYTAHMTIVKLSRPMQRELHTGVISPALYQQFMDMNVGSNPIKTLYLCSMSAPKLADGFYERLSEVNNSLSGLPPQFVYLLTKRLDFFCSNGVITENEHASLCKAIQQSVDGNSQEFDVAIDEIIRLGQEETMCTTSTNITQVPIVIAFRGVPGSGKSFLATHCSEYLTNSANVAVCSADYYFMSNGQYKYSTKHLAQAHSHCFDLFLQALEQDKQMIVVDNTNSKKWEYEIYKYVSVILGCKFHALEVPCPSEKILETYRSRNQHNIDSNTALKIFQRWEVDDTASLVPPFLAYPRMIQSTVPDYSLVSLCSPREAKSVQVLQQHTALTAVYTAVFLTTESQWKLVSTIAPTHPRIKADHITLVFEPGKQACLAANIGTRITVHVTGSVDNGQIQVAIVELPREVPYANSVPHVTVSAEERVSFKQANDMLQRHTSKPLYQTLELEGIIGVMVREKNDLDGSGTSDRENQAGIVSRTKPDLANQPTFVIESESDFKQYVLPKLSSTLEDIELEKSTQICTGKQKITCLNIFDFDGTLFTTPEPKKSRQVYENYMGQKWECRGWLVWPESLLPPVITSPGPALPTYRDHIGQAGSKTIILTGRIERTKPGVTHVLENFNVYPEQLILKPDSDEDSTPVFKANVVQKLLKENSDITLVRFWDDNPRNLSALHRLSMTAYKHVRFEIVDATKMVPTVATKRGKKMKLESSPGLNNPASQVESYSSNLQTYLSSCGYLPSKNYTSAADCGVRFIAEQFCKLIGYSGNPLHLVYTFGSAPLGRRGDIDLCLLCPSHFTPTDSLEQLSRQLNECGINYIHRGFSTRCPRLKIMLVFPSSCPIDYDIVCASIDDSSFFDAPQLSQIPAPKIFSQIKPEGSASKTAFTGAVLLHNLLAEINGCVSISHFGAVVEMIVQILAAQQQKGNAYHCIRTFHIVRLLADFIKICKDSFKQINCDELFKEFVIHAARVSDREWEKLFGEFVPVEFILKVRKVFEITAQEVSLLDKGASPSLECYESLTNKSTTYPPDGYTLIELNLSGSNAVELWRLHTIVEARLPSYIRQLISSGLDILPDGNTENKRKFSFAVPQTKSVKPILQQVLRPFWNEISKFRNNEEGVNITLNFGQSDTQPDRKSNQTDAKKCSLPAIDDITRFMSDPKQNEIHISSHLTSYERMLVHETCEQLGLSHVTITDDKQKHIIVRKK